MYAAYGVASPFLPAFVSSRGIGPQELGLVLAAGTAARLVSAPLAGRAGDLLERLRGVLVLCVALAAFVTLGYLSAEGFWLFLAVSVAQAAALAPTVLADALALGAAKRERFEYGWVRGTGSAAFIAGTLASGQLVGTRGLGIIVVLQAALLAAAAVAARFVPELVDRRKALPRTDFRVGTLARLPAFRYLVAIAALVLGSHAMHDAFAMIRWRAAGIEAGTASVLWSEAVLAEVVVFFLIGPALIRRLTPAGALGLAAIAGIVRWSVMASSADVAALALVQPLHGITFALLHLACMRLIAATVPHGLEGTAQAIYGTVGIGGASAVVTLVSGSLYERLGADGFWVMAGLCMASLPLIFRLWRFCALH
jgi:MFS transporter, PPP family, 3-phenylpropionic acid transporter